MTGGWTICVAAALLGFGLAAPVSAADGTFVVVSDFHFNPFDPPQLAKTLAATDLADWPAELAVPGQAMSVYDNDTNAALLRSALAALGQKGAGADFVVLPGDLLAHKFVAQAAATLGAADTSEQVRAFAGRTTIFVADAVKTAVGGKPVFVALGNNDSGCGDYRIDPNGAYLVATREAVRHLVGPELLAADFDETYAAGGYYAARHPTVANGLIIVLDDVLWSAEYENACGSGGNAAGYAMLAWLRDKLAAQKAAGGPVWLVHHIPFGIDAYSTSHSRAATCGDKVVPFLAEPFASDYPALLREFSSVVRANLVGHVHFDDYRLLLDDRQNAVAVEKITPAISPIYRQNPGFQIFTYDKTTGVPIDFSTVALTNLTTAATPEAGDWQPEYTFSAAYGQPGYSVESVAAIWKAIAQPGAARDTYLRLYNLGHGGLDPANLPAYVCAMGHADVASFTACYCGG